MAPNSSQHQALGIWLVCGLLVISLFAGWFLQISSPETLGKWFIPVCLLAPWLAMSLAALFWALARKISRPRSQPDRPSQPL